MNAFNDLDSKIKIKFPFQQLSIYVQLRFYAFYRFTQLFMLLLNTFQLFFVFIHFHLNQKFSNSVNFISVLVQKSLFLSLLQIQLQSLVPLRKPCMNSYPYFLLFYSINPISKDHMQTITNSYYNLLLCFSLLPTYCY